MTNLVAGSFLPCDGFRAAVEHDEPFCRSCGHLADDHESDAHQSGDRTDARVTQLRRAPVRRSTPVRKAS